MIDFFRDAVQALKDGASLDGEILAQVREELCLRQQALPQSDLPPTFQPVLELYHEALNQLVGVLDGLDMASREDAPEFAPWLAVRAQDAWERLRAVEQQLAQQYETLDEEIHQHGNR